MLIVLRSCYCYVTYRGARGYSLEVLRHALVLLHVVVEHFEGAVDVGFFYLGHVLIVGFVCLSVWLEHLDVVLNLMFFIVQKTKTETR